MPVPLSAFRKTLLAANSCRSLQLGCANSSNMAFCDGVGERPMKYLEHSTVREQSLLIGSGCDGTSTAAFR